MSLGTLVGALGPDIDQMITKVFGSLPFKVRSNCNELTRTKGCFIWCIPVGCVPPACCPYPVVSVGGGGGGGGGLPYLGGLPFLGGLPSYLWVVCLTWGVCLTLGGGGRSVLPEGSVLLGGQSYLRALSYLGGSVLLEGSVLLGGGGVSLTWGSAFPWHCGNADPPTNRITHAWENITFLIHCVRAVITVVFKIIFVEELLYVVLLGSVEVQRGSHRWSWRKRTDQRLDSAKRSSVS